MNFAGGAAAKMSSPPRRQPPANRQAVETHIETDASVVPDPCLSFSVNAALTLRAWRQIGVVDSEQRLGDEHVRLAQIKIGDERHF